MSKDYLAMSDEDFSNHPYPEDSEETIEESQIAEDTQEVDEEDQETEYVEDTSSTETTDTTEEDSTEDEVDEGTEAEPEVPESTESEGKDEKDNVEETKEADKATDTTKVDYEAVYKELTAPFKANGKDIQVQSVEDIKSLMQMGANYNKKMTQLKPRLKIIKMLEDNGLLDEAKLSYLIDVDKKNPEAISKLIKDSGLDAFELDEEKAKEYKPGNYKVSDAEMELDTVIEEISSTPTFQKTLNLVGNEWDPVSRQKVANNPAIIKLINAHMANGVYDVVAKELESLRVLGKLDGLSDIEAYGKVSDAIHARGGFSHLFPVQDQVPSNQPVVDKTKFTPRVVSEDKRVDKRKAASPTKSSGLTVSKDTEANILAMSDEEFLKQGLGKEHLM